MENENIMEEEKVEDIYISIYIYSAKSGEKKTEEIVTKNRESRKRKREYISE